MSKAVNAYAAEWQTTGSAATTPSLAQQVDYSLMCEFGRLVD
jgi:hypothetical protein